MKYAGVGSRETPLPIIREMENIAMQIALRGWLLRTGGAVPPVINAKPGTDSADQAFERACRLVSGKCVYRVATLWEPALEHAAKFHPNWDNLNENKQSVYARVSMILLGDDRAFNDPVKMVITWTANPDDHTQRVAALHGIPVFNLANAGAVDALWQFVEQAR